MIDPDGSGTIDITQLHARAFLQDDMLTIYALNFDKDKEWENLHFKLSSGYIIGSVEGRQWAEGYPDEGKTGEIKPFAGKSFKVDLPPGTINIFTCKIKP